MSRPGTVKPHLLDYKGRRYYFYSDVYQWIFEREPEKFHGHKSIVDRFRAGEIQPPTLEGALQYMGMSPADMGKDADDYARAEEYRVG